MLRALQRRGWVLLVTVMVSGACAYLVASLQGTTYTAESTAVVADNSKEALHVVTPDQATMLASTYAVVIREDTEMLHTMATRLGISVSEVQDRLSVYNTTGTAFLIFEYKGTSPENAIKGATIALHGVASARPFSPNIIPLSVGAVSTPSTASASRGVTVLVTIGVIVGIALGLVLIVAWERIDPRIDRPEDLSQEIGSPTSPASEISESGANALIARWKALAEPGPSRIALVPATSDVQADLPTIALTFSKVDGNGNGAEPPSRNGTRGRIADSDVLTQPVGSGTPMVIACEVPSADLTALQSIMDCDLVVLVARKGTPRATLRELLESLTEFGVPPKWAIFLGSLPARVSAVPEADER